MLSLLFILGCTLPSSESLRPRGVDLSVDGGQSEYHDRGRQGGRGTSDDWRVGMSVHWDITYDDEYEEAEE